MVTYCCIVNCSSVSRGGKQSISFFRIPAVIGLNSRRYQTLYKTKDYRVPNSIDESADKIIALSKKRQTAWINAIKRGKLKESQLRNFRVCSKHFISGKPAELTDRDNPDWIPCQNLGYTAGCALKSQSALERYKRFLKRKELDTLQTSELFDASEEIDSDICNHCHRSFKLENSKIKIDHSLCMKKPKLKIMNESEEPTELDKKEKSTELQKVPHHSQNSQKIIQHFSKKDKENPSSSSTSTNLPTSTTKVQSLTEADISFQSHANLITSTKYKNKLDELLARAIYANSSPMELIENYHWKQFFKAIRPIYNPPSALDLRGYLLENEYKRVMALVNKKISTASALVLVTYGWSSPKGEMHFIVATPEPVYFKCLLSKDKKDEIYVSKQIAEIIEKIGSNKLMLLFTEDVPNLEEAWDILTDAYPHITICGSAAENVKLLFKDVIKLNTVQEILKKAQEMVLSIHINEANVKKNEEQAKIHVRLGAISILKTLLENKSLFQGDIVPDEMIPETVMQEILDEDKEFWTEAERLLKLLDYIVEAIQILEADRTLLSDVPKVFKGIQEKLLTWMKECPHILNEEKNTICYYILVRKQSAIKAIHQAANLLDPRYRGKDLDDSGLTGAIEFLKQRSDYLGMSLKNVCENLEDYKTSSGAYARSFLWGTAKHITPVEWWRNFCGNQLLCRFAVQLLSISANPGVYQEMFKGIQMNPRHELKPEDLEKLITIKSNLLRSRDTESEVLGSILSS